MHRKRHLPRQCVCCVEHIYTISFPTWFRSHALSQSFPRALYSSPGSSRVLPCYANFLIPLTHYNDVIMGTIASQITSLTIVYSTDYSDANQRKHQSSASLVFVRGFHRRPVNSPHKWPVTRKMFRLMTSSWVHWFLLLDQICLSPYQGWWLAPDQWETSLQSNAVSNFINPG